MWETFRAFFCGFFLVCFLCVCLFFASSSSRLLYSDYKTVLFYEGPIPCVLDGDDPTQSTGPNVCLKMDGYVTQSSKNLPHNSREWG